MSSISLPSRITAIGISKTGDVDVIEKLDLPFPSPAPGQFVIKVSQIHSGSSEFRTV